MGRFMHMHMQMTLTKKHALRVLLQSPPIQPPRRRARRLGLAQQPAHQQLREARLAPHRRADHHRQRRKHQTEGQQQRDGVDELHLELGLQKQRIIKM